MREKLLLESPRLDDMALEWDDAAAGGEPESAAADVAALQALGAAAPPVPPSADAGEESKEASASSGRPSQGRQASALSASAAAAGGFYETVVSTVIQLAVQRYLPAIVFHLDETAVRRMLDETLAKLESWEEQWKATSPKWQETLRLHKEAMKRVKKKKNEKDGSSAGSGGMWPGAAHPPLQLAVHGAPSPIRSQ